MSPHTFLAFPYAFSETIMNNAPVNIPLSIENKAIFKSIYILVPIIGKCGLVTIKIKDKIKAKRNPIPILMILRVYNFLVLEIYFPTVSKILYVIMSIILYQCFGIPLSSSYNVTPGNIMNV